MKQAIILAGGKGTRLRERLGDLPKPLIDICGIPLLERQIRLLKTYGFEDVLLLVNYASDKIIEFCELNNNWNINISCIDDGEPLGTAGAILKIYDRLASDFLIVYGDTMLDVNLDLFYKYHIKDSSSVATLYLHPNDHPHDSDLVEILDNGKILGFYPYPHNPSLYYPNLVNAALYCIKKEGITPWKDNKGILDFGKDLFPLMLKKNLFLRGYNSIEYIKDCGTPHRLDKVCNDLISGKIAKSSLNYPQKAIFIDRDGTINIEVDHLNSVDQFELLPGTANAIKALNHSNYLVCIITNQPVVARGECSFSELKQIHNKMETLLGNEGAFVDRIYYCPHHPDSGYIGEIKELKIKCDCRKPETGLIDKAVGELNIQRSLSWLVGDSTSDILTAKRAGLKSILVETGYAGLDQKYWSIPDYIVPDINFAVSFILETYPKLYDYCSDLSFDIKKGNVVVVGGLSRSGKSTFSSVFRDVIIGQGKTCHVISLDRWLKNEEDRKEGVTGRYDIDAIEDLFDKIANRSCQPLKLNLPGYHKLTKKQVNSVERLEIGKDDIIIIEGTIALKLDNNKLQSRHRFFINFSEKHRKERVINEYLLRKYSLQEANDIYNQRQLDETPTIKRQKDIININMDIFYQ